MPNSKKPLTASELITRAVISDSRKRAKELAAHVKATAAELQSGVVLEAGHVKQAVTENIGIHQQLDSQTFGLLMARFDTIEKQNDKQLELLQDHIKVDDAVHTVVNRHSTYFSILALGIPVGIAGIMNKLGWKVL